MNWQDINIGDIVKTKKGSIGRVAWKEESKYGRAIRLESILDNEHGDMLCTEIKCKVQIKEMP